MIPPAFRSGSHPRARSIDGLISLLSQLKSGGLPGDTKLGPVSVRVKRGKDRSRIVVVRPD